MFNHYDVIVIGGGHAGCEAAAAAGRLGSSVLLITLNLSTIAQMSCNPAMGGIAKGQIIREIDALGGYSGIVTDHTMIQFRMLNRSKGPAMWSPRAQSDRNMFAQKWQQILMSIENVHIWQDSVTNILTDETKRVRGVVAAFAGEISSNQVIITSGTFLNGKIHIGRNSTYGGRLGESNSAGLTESILNLGIQSERLKTGTPVRVDGRSIDFSVLTEQPGDEEPGKFSFTNTPFLENQLSCYLVHTNEKTHAILREGFEDSPLFAGRIQGSGPRYCPSIEDKIERFSERERHQLFIEPEGRNTTEFYINGFSSSLPIDIQFRALKEVPGFGNARITKPGYAIEYDYFPPTQLKSSLESKVVKGLFFAGQVNGTTGYEEAACQGLIAGINAHRKRINEDALVIKRSEAYIGVLIDDLVTKGTKEPYRMFTSRAEFRILLRQDNADQRLTPIGKAIGLSDDERNTRLRKKIQFIEQIKYNLQTHSAQPDTINSLLEQAGTAPIQQKTKFANLLLRPQVRLKALMEHNRELLPVAESYEDTILNEAIDSSEIEIKYKGYIDKEEEMAEKINRLENLSLGNSIQYNAIHALSNEAREKLSAIKPSTIGQASRISGINPSDIAVLLVHLGR
ncbi:MAG: tRNA uridine-5-carboxymethylaminomethyl(34) synthesis enzyme MnmG [Bacteroidia bacterium]|nr:MAG: tRNA uridine-5-carboxymethylaminomethyl(34) synthesis enzyme MnmG [Bacteroidia bacterium]